MTAGIQSLRSSERAAAVSVTPKDVRALDDEARTAAGVATPCAEVKFDLTLNDSPVVPDQTGYAVRQGDRWKVGKVTFCSLAGLGGSVPAGC
jgi:hypothetical protein